MEILSEFTLSQSINWLKDINLKLIERIELIESIIAKNKVEESDIERLKIIDKHHYTSWEILELPLDYDNLDLCLTIYNSTILDARNKYETFFDYQNDREFELHQYYLSKFISYNIEVDFFIQYFDNLSIQLTELSLTFSGCMHESEYGFCFNNVMNFANKEPDLMKRKQIYLDSFAAFNMYWIKSELCFPKETDEYKSQLEHFETYCFGCQKAIDTIDIQLQNIPISTKKDFRLIYENPIPNKNTTSPTNKLTNTIESTLIEKEKILSRYLEAVDSSLRAFMFEIDPQNEDVLVIAKNTKQFTTALKELYFSDNPNKEEFYILLHREISKATFHINDDNLNGKNPNIWKPICHALEIAENYTSELRFKETNYYFPFQDVNSDENHINDNSISSKKENSSYQTTKTNKFDSITINDYCEFLLGISNHSYFINCDFNKTTKSEMFDFIKEKTDNFDLNKFIYFIDDVRNVEIPFYDKISYERLHNAMLFFSIFENHDYVNKSLYERYKIVKAENSGYIASITTTLVDFSDIAEKEYAKALKNSEKKNQHINLKKVVEIQRNENLINHSDNHIDYNQIHITDFCNFLMGIGNSQLFIVDESKTFTKTKMYDYIKINTDNFNPVKLKYFIEDLRDFSNHITFNLKKNDNRTIECDGTTGNRMEFLFNGLPADTYHYSDNNDFTPEQIENHNFFNKIEIEKNTTLPERINLLKSSIPNIHFPGTFTKLFQFSDIAEVEFNKTYSNDNQEDIKHRYVKNEKLMLIDFFKDKSNSSLISQLQNEFQSYSGKSMAIVVFLLFTKYNLIKIIPNSKTQSRKHFVSLLNNLPDNISMQSIDKHFQSGTDNITISENDALFVSINEKITQMINK